MIMKMDNKIQKARKTFTDTLGERKLESGKFLLEDLRLTDYFFEKRGFFEGAEKVLKIDESKANLMEFVGKVKGICEDEISLDFLIKDGNEFARNMFFLEMFAEVEC